ncbi:DNA-binding transcriptional regulator, MarR family [Actinomyces ruminicola]|uniref:DNA-binding transcriptional regulator, MarR family n=1 Tax=Actinomyces ruminicola TaxID=332524 RepID=A0A1G9ZYJ5_9ACTO|nr:MarR family transcriptional regulator [Actinomyces ruminicola]SDN26672.1 DNA-binding transcriptional regulator, MarR family [Actinomyces ruminicola]
METYVPTPANALGNRIDAAVAMLYRRTFSYVSRELAGEGFGSGKQAVIRILDTEDGITQTAVADRGALDAGNVARIVAALEADGYVRRERDTTALHAYRVFLTERGRAAAVRMHEVVDAWNATCYADLSLEEMAALARRLECLAARADEIWHRHDRSGSLTES